MEPGTWNALVEDQQPIYDLAVGARRAPFLTSQTLLRAHSVRPYNRLQDIAPKERQGLSLLCVSVVKFARAWLQDRAELER